MPSDDAEKITTSCGNFRKENADKCVDCAESTLNYVEMLTVNKIDNKAFAVYEQH